MKAQVAMETILIYGLAILIVTSTAGYLISTKTIDTSSLLPDKCQIDSVDLFCSEYSAVISPSEHLSGLKIEIRNNMNVDVEINKLIVRGKRDMTGMWKGNKKCELTKTVKIYHETTELLKIKNCDIKLPIGSKIKGTINISYNKVGSNFNRITFGEILTNVAEGCFGGDQEICNNKDDNCNAQIDENLEQVCEITNQYGTCIGMEICDKGKWINCNARIPAQEECNGVDDNCNALIDEGLEDCCECATPDICQAGKKGYLCNGCHYILAPEEICDGKDNDCDKEVDEDLTPPKCENQLGVCKGSTKTCDGINRWLPCDASNYGSSYEETETNCNDGKDNDCNGECDYDGCGAFTHGDKRCGVGIIP